MFYTASVIYLIVSKYYKNNLPLSASPDCNVNHAEALWQDGWRSCSAKRDGCNYGNS